MDLIRQLSLNEERRTHLERRAAGPELIRKGISSGGVDVDESGTYDPDEERRLELQRRRQRLMAARAKKAAEFEADMQQEEEGEGGHAVGQQGRVVVGLKVDSAEAKRRLEEIVAGGPRKHAVGNPVVKDVRNSTTEQMVQLMRRLDAEGTTAPVRGSVLSVGDRGSHADVGEFDDDDDDGSAGTEIDRGDDDSTTVTDSEEDEDDSDTDDANSESGQSDDESAVTTPEDRSFATTERSAGSIRPQDEDLHLDHPLSQPRKSISCNECRDSGKRSCSLYKSNQYPCRHCHKLSLPCTFVYLSPTPPPPSAAAEGLPPRKYVACSQCRTARRRCSLKRDDVGPCNACAKDGEVCRFVLIPTATQLPRRHEAHRRERRKAKLLERKRKRERTALGRAKTKRKAGKTTTSARPRKQPTTTRRRTDIANAGVPVQRRQTRTGIKRTISTSFCHPIDFNSDFCSFCPSVNPYFGLFGHGKKEAVVVLDQIDSLGAGYTELRGGHAESGELDATSMCAACVDARVAMISCRQHVMRRMVIILDDDDDDAVRDPYANHRLVYNIEALCQSYQAYVSDDPHGLGAGALAFNCKWCSICPAPAEFYCHAPSEVGDGAEKRSDVHQDGHTGCGLRLCTACNVLLKHVHRPRLPGSSLNEVDVLGELVRMASSPEQGMDYENGVRADASFLTRSGEMFRRLIWGMRDTEA